MRLVWGLFKLGFLVGVGIWVGWRTYGTGNLETRHLQDKIEAAAARSEWVQKATRSVRDAVEKSVSND